MTNEQIKRLMDEIDKDMAGGAVERIGNEMIAKGIMAEAEDEGDYISDLEDAVTRNAVAAMEADAAWADEKRRADRSREDCVRSILLGAGIAMAGVALAFLIVWGNQ